MSDYRVTIKQSVFENTGLNPEKYEGEMLTFEDETEAQSLVEDMNEDLSAHGSLTLHSAHPNDSSDVDAYLIFNSEGFWVVDE